MISKNLIDDWEFVALCTTFVGLSFDLFDPVCNSIPSHLSLRFRNPNFLKLLVHGIIQSLQLSLFCHNFVSVSMRWF
ncbi:hypothetical protein JHK82_032031 [Glycine max]|uniref:Uncharacterized protein n=2 Tax=Glycine subgen. Soja TaxID=1462606 RepID=A0A0R0HKL1_SOYBN|nr:hypothetical protein JHK87_031965 [Glycine soja]KAG4989715.1 hypothetical protein JHK85_032698 [Glycine max]KAG4995301.1 hypothetical protein JHK86_032128 [Glycine max]KAG5125294.1 hypothetical protein JHK82_032031 [Glycine max]KAG5146721.1 hypothetical protein JHK84_032264 [Glycine max]